MKPTRTDNNKPSQSTPIRKGKVSPEEIKRTAEELTGSKFVNDLIEAKRTIEKGLKVVEAPKIEPVQHGNYEIYSAYVKAHCKVHDIYETTANELNKLFPQNKSTYDIVRNLKRSHGISYRRVDDSNYYVFFVEPTREELIVMLTSAESKVIELEKKILVIEKTNDETNKSNDKFFKTFTEENTQLKSDLSNSQRSNNILFRFAIGAVITIIFKSVAL